MLGKEASEKRNVADRFGLWRVRRKVCIDLSSVEAIPAKFFFTFVHFPTLRLRFYLFPRHPSLLPLSLSPQHVSFVVIKEGKRNEGGGRG